MWVCYPKKRTGKKKRFANIPKESALKFHSTINEELMDAGDG
jgi:hypothetical protein